MTASTAQRRLLAAGIALAAIAIAMRVNNAFEYPLLYGYDAVGNWRYIEHLSYSWDLPAPDAGWSTAHPPLFYYVAASLNRLLHTLSNADRIAAVRLLCAAAGIAFAALAGSLVLRMDPRRPYRALLAAGLVLILPAQILVSAMVNEELLAALFTSIAIVGLVRAVQEPGDGRAELTRAAVVGLAGGLALLTKLSGALVVAVAAATYGIDGWRRRAIRPAALRIAAVLLVAGVVGGWYYARSFVRYGYLYPHALRQHQIMLLMPPGERSPTDYLRLPLATWTDPQIMAPDLLHSVLGSTYVMLWFDGQRFLLPRTGETVRRAGMALLVLALLPTLAFGVGLARGVRRTLRDPAAADLPLLLLVAFTLAGYVAFTWRNPWFAAVKGSYLLGLSIPFAFYASETLADWTRGRNPRAVAVRVLLGALALGVVITFSQGLVFEKSDLPGLPFLDMAPG